MFIDDRNKENYVDIYPFIDDAKDAGFSARITVCTNRNVEEFGRVRYQGQYWSEDEFSKFVAAMNEAYKLAKAEARMANFRYGVSANLQILRSKLL